MEDSEIQFEKPKGAVESVPESEIHVMPDRFRGVTVSAKIPEASTSPSSGLRGPMEPSKGAKPVKVPKAPRVPGERKKFPWIIIIVVIVILAALGASVFFVLQGFKLPNERAPQSEEEVSPEETVVPMPSPAEPEEIVIEEEEEFATSEVSLPATIEENIPATSEVSITPEPVEPEMVYTPGVDSDSDGLTDVEEALYGTDARKPDTDSDGFLDGNEVYHLYNPGGTAPVTLLESGLVKEYRNQENGYVIYYPDNWSLDASKGSDFVMFSAQSGEWVQVLVEENAENLTLEDWYLRQAPGVDAGELKTFFSKAGIEGLQSPDRLTAYFKSDSKIFAISLNLGAKSSIEYRRTYEMILNSFKFVE